MRILLSFLVFIFSSSAYSYQVSHTHLKTPSYGGNCSVTITYGNYNIECPVVVETTVYQPVTDLNGVETCTVISKTDSDPFYENVEGKTISWNSAGSRVDTTNCSSAPYDMFFSYTYPSDFIKVTDTAPPSTIMSSSQPDPNDPANFCDVNNSLYDQQRCDAYQAEQNNPLASPLCDQSDPNYNLKACLALTYDDPFSDEEDITSPNEICIGPCCEGTPGYDIDLCNALTSPIESDTTPPVEDAIQDDPANQPPEPSPESSQDSQDIVNSINSLSDRLANFFEQSASRQDLFTQTGELVTSIDQSTNKTIQATVDSANFLAAQMDKQGDRTSGLIVDLKSTVIAEGTATRSAIDAQTGAITGAINGLDTSTTVNIDTQGIIDAQNQTTSIIDDLGNFFGDFFDTSGVDLEGTDPTQTFLDSVPSLSEQKTTVQNALAENEQVFNFDEHQYQVNLFNHVGCPTTQFTVLGYTHTFNWTYLCMVMSFMGNLLYWGSYLLAFYIVVNGRPR